MASVIGTSSAKASDVVTLTGLEETSTEVTPADIAAIGFTPSAATASIVSPATLTASPAAGPAGTLAANKMEIDVNYTTGDITVYGNSAAKITGVEISSASGSLIGANATTNGTPFTLLLNNTNNDIQLGRLGSTTINGGVDLGDIYNTTLNSEDLTFAYGQNGSTLTNQSVVYVPTGSPEPTSLALVGVGALGVLSRKRRKQA